MCKKIGKIMHYLSNHTMAYIVKQFLLKTGCLLQISLCEVLKGHPM